MSADVIELYSEGGAGGVSGACFGINSCESKHFFDDLLKRENGCDAIRGDVESRATRATYATQAQHWLDALLDDRPEIPADPAPCATAPKAWRVTLPGREPFGVICVQGATADQMRKQWPRASVEPMP